MMPNQMKMTVKMTRREVLDLRLACNLIAKENPDTKRWATLAGKLDAMIKSFDDENGIN